MSQYFSANTQHLDDHFLLTHSTQHPRILTYGDTLLKLIDPISSHQQEYPINDMEYTNIALAPDATHCLLANNSSLFRFDFSSKDRTVQGENIVNGAITSLCYSNTGKFVAIGSEEGKPVIYQPLIGKKSKCRPGHTSKVVSVLISINEEYLCSIGQDKSALIYQLSNGQPRQVAKYMITKLDNCDGLKASFHPTKMMVLLPGENYLQKLELIQQRWQFIKMEKIMHKSVIMLTQTPKSNTVVTSSREEVCLWNIRTQQKLFQIQQFHLTQTISLIGTFFGTHGDGQLYTYKRQIKQVQAMDIEQVQDSQKIDFQNVEDNQDRQQDEEEQEKRKQMEYKHQKKSKADKIITCMPQNVLSSATRMFDGQRFLFVNTYGCVIQKQEETQQQSTIQVQFCHEQSPKRMIIAKNRQLLHFDINPFVMVYASQNQFGLKIGPDAQLESWQINWNGITAITMGTGWIAVANENQIRIFDMYGHQIRSIAFDRDLIALRSHQNMLAAVYHQSIPMFGSQQLAMQLYLVDLNRAPIPILSPIHVPIHPGSILNYFDFSLQGMIITQDTSGSLRIFSLQRNDWTSVSITGIDDTRKAWIIGCKDYELIYWKTSQTDDQPTVAPRFMMKYGLFTIPTIGSYPQGARQIYQTLLWNRFSLDHQKARSRLWGRFKLSRQKNNRYYYLIESIFTQKEIVMKHNELDDKFHSLIQLYLKSNEAYKALYLCMSCIRSIDALKKMAELFDYYNQRKLAIQLEEFCEEKTKEIQYEAMQTFSFMRLRQAVQKTIKPKIQDPMGRSVRKKITQSIPSLSQNFSQESIMQVNNNLLNESNISGVTEDFNPFLKRRNTQEQLEAKKKEITQHVEKFGIKKKVQQRNLSRKL